MMKTNTLIAAIFMTCASFSSFAQNGQNSQKNVRVEVFTPQEKDNTQMWFIEKTDSLNLSQENRQQYIAVIERNMNNVFHLTDSDNDYDKAEIKERLKAIFDKTDKEVKSILNNKQYKEHLETSKAMRVAYERRLDNPSEETNLCDHLDKIKAQEKK